MLFLCAIFVFLLVSSIPLWVAIESLIKRAFYQLHPSFGEETSNGPETVWAGFLGQAAIFLFLSLFTPLNIAVAAVFYGALWGYVALKDSLRNRFISIVREAYARAGLLSPILLLIATAFYCSQAPCNYDTLLYHHQATQWYSEHGSVRGVSLIHYRLGFISSTFALAAPFESLAQHRTATIANGAALLLALLQVSYSISRIFNRRGSNKDWFIAFGMGGVLGLHLLFLEPASAAPDFMINVATIAIAACFLAPTTNLAAFVAAALLPTVKLSAAPVAVVAAVVGILFSRSLSVKKRVLLVGAIGIVSALPLVSTSWWQTGNLLFPMKATQTDTPWTHSDEQLKFVSEGIRDWARWGGEKPKGAADSDWIAGWAKSSKGLLFIAATLGNVFAFFGTLFFRRTKQGRHLDLAIPIIGLIGTAYLLVAAPNPRFGFGMLMLGWSWIACCLGPGLWESIHRRLPEKPLSILSKNGSYLVAGCILIVLAGLTVRPLDAWRRALNAHLQAPFLSASNGRTNWLLPATVPTIGYQREADGKISGAFEVEFAEDQVNDVLYAYPTNTDMSGARKIPAASERLRDIRLHVPKEGIRQGFERVRE